MSDGDECGGEQGREGDRGRRWHLAVTLFYTLWSEAIVRKRHSREDLKEAREGAMQASGGSVSKQREQPELGGGAEVLAWLPGLRGKGAGVEGEGVYVAGAE